MAILTLSVLPIYFARVAPIQGLRPGNEHPELCCRLWLQFLERIQVQMATIREKTGHSLDGMTLADVATLSRSCGLHRKV